MRLFDVFSQDEDTLKENQTADMRAFFAGTDRDSTVQNPSKTTSTEIKTLLAKLLQFGERSLTPSELIKVREYKRSTSLHRRQFKFEEGVAEGHGSEELANEVYAEFERTYPNLARRADERTVHAAIMDVLNYGGDSNPSALAQDVARAVKQEMQQGVAEAAALVTHRIGLTVTDPNHPMVSKRGETYQKSVRVTGPDREAAINQAIAHYRRKGYKVHDHHYLGTVDKPMAEATGDKPFDQMMTTIKRGTNKQKTADRKEQQKQTQQQARNAFGNMFGGGNPADKLKIREQGVAEDSLNEDPVIQFASKAHNEWRKNFDPTGTKERIKKNSDGTEGNINVPFEELHPDWKKENLAAGQAAMMAVKRFPNNIEQAAEYIHNEWMKRNPKADYNAAQHVAYDQLPEDEKEKDRVHVRTMMALSGKQGVAEGHDDEDPFELSSDYALHIANAGRKMMTQLANMSKKIQTDSTAAQNANRWNLGDFMHQHYETDDLNAINQVFEEYGVGGFFDQNLYELLSNWSSQGPEYVTAWKQYSGDVIKNSTRQPSAQSVHEQGVAEDSLGLKKLHDTLWTVISEQTIDEENINEIDPGMIANLYSVFPTVTKIIVSNALDKARKEAKETSIMIDVMKKHANNQPVTPEENEAMKSQFKDIVSYGLSAVAGVLTGAVAGPAAGVGVALAGAYKKELLTLLQTKGPEVLIGLLKSKGKLDVVDILSAKLLGKHALPFYAAPAKLTTGSVNQGVAEAGNANSGRRGPDYQDNSPVVPGRVEHLPQGLRHHADASRYGGTEPDNKDDRLLGPQQRHRLHRAVTPDDLDEQEKIAGRHDPDDFDNMVGRLKQLAGAGPLKTVWDPAKRVYKNVPHAVQPPQQPKKAPQ